MFKFLKTAGSGLIGGGGLTFLENVVSTSLIPVLLLIRVISLSMSTLLTVVLCLDSSHILLYIAGVLAFWKLSLAYIGHICYKCTWLGCI